MDLSLHDFPLKLLPGISDNNYVITLSHYLFQGGCMVNQMVLSKEIEWIGYEHKNRMLQVEFIAGGIYQYENVPPQIYDEFLSADSHGRFFETKIKSAYPYRKIRA